MLSFVLASFFVISVYIWKPIFNPPYKIRELRNNQTRLSAYQQAQIDEFESKMRTQSVGSLCFLALLCIIMAADHVQRPEVSILKWFGFRVDLHAIKYTTYALALNSLLFAGEIFQLIRGMEDVGYILDFKALKTLVLAPLFEELIYRVCIINIFLESGALDPLSCALYLPAFFSISHVHHAFQSKKKEKSLRKRHLCAMTLFQMMYTQIFGIYSGLVYIKTGSIWPVIFLHAQCNFFGFPSFKNFFERRFRLSDRIIMGVLYVVGLIAFFYYFN